MWDFPGSPVVKTPCFHCRGHGFDPSRGTMIMHATWWGQKKKIKLKKNHVCDWHYISIGQCWCRTPRMLLDFCPKFWFAPLSLYQDGIGLFYLFIYLVLLERHAGGAGWILVPWPGIVPLSPAVEAWSLNHWTAREVPSNLLNQYLQLTFFFHSFNSLLEWKPVLFTTGVKLMKH